MSMNVNSLHAFAIELNVLFVITSIQYAAFKVLRAVELQIFSPVASVNCLHWEISSDSNCLH